MTHALIGIVTRNRAPTLPSAIRSALAQDWPAKTVAVLDDASADDTPALRHQFPAVEWLRTDSAVGPIVGRNLLLESSAADFFAGLDDDARFVRGDELSRAIELLQAQPAVAAVAFDVLFPHRPLPQPRRPPRPVASFIGCGFVLRTATARQVGLFTPSPGLYMGEEWDLSLRLADAGYAIVKLPGVHVYHELTMAARDVRAQHRCAVCNDLAILTRRCPLPHLLWLLPLKVAAHLRSALEFGWRPKANLVPHDRDVRARAGHCGLATAVFAGCTLFARKLPAIWAQRQPVRSKTFTDALRLTRRS